MEHIIREAIAWGRAYGSAIPAHQWDEMRDAKVQQLVAVADRAATAHFVVYSANETAAGGRNAGFWSNNDGWVEMLEDASRFTEEETKVLRLPLSLGQDAKWYRATEFLPKVTLWLASVEHQSVPGIRTVALYQAEEPTDEEILARFEGEDGITDDEGNSLLSVVSIIDVNHIIATDASSCDAVKAFASTL